MQTNDWARRATSAPKAMWIRVRALPALASFWLRQPLFYLFASAMGLMCWMVASDLKSRKSAIHWMAGGSLLPPGLSLGEQLFFDFVHVAVVFFLVLGVALRILPFLRPAAQSPKGLAARQRYDEVVERLSGRAAAQQEAAELRRELSRVDARALGLNGEKGADETSGQKPTRGARRL